MKNTTFLHLDLAGHVKMVYFCPTANVSLTLNSLLAVALGIVDVPHQPQQHAPHEPALNTPQERGPREPLAPVVIDVPQPKCKPPPERNSGSSSGKKALWNASSSTRFTVVENRGCIST
jgi:hypothetical protein